MNDSHNLPNLPNDLLKIKQNIGLAIGLVLSELALTFSGQLKPAEQGAIQAKILNNPSIVAAAKTEQKGEGAPNRGKGRRNFV